MKKSNITTSTNDNDNGRNEDNTNAIGRKTPIYEKLRACIERFSVSLIAPHDITVIDKVRSIREEWVG